jgi:heavy metal sensor kinase
MTLPIRVRLTAWYAGLLAVAILGLGAFLVLQLRSDLRATVDRDVHAAAVQLARGYGRAGAPEFLDVSETVLAGSGAASQVLDADGRVLLTYGEPGAAHALLSRAQLARVLAGGRELITVELQPGDEHYRAQALAVPGNRRVVVVAESLSHVEESVRRVLILLLLAGPAAVAIASVGGWWLARKALRPVYQMASAAATIGIERLHERVAVPRAQDEIGHLAVTLNAMLDRLEQGVIEKHRLISDASHELRTPLAVMRAELDVSLRSGDLSPGGRAVLESAREEVDTMSRTVDNLLTLAQADEGRLELLTERTPLREAVEAAVAPLRPLAAAKRVRLRVDTGAGEVLADPQRLRQAVTSFVENAIKFSPPGGEVGVTAWHDGSEAGVTVVDDGPGIPAAHRPHVFDRFYRVDGARGREVGGSGLGLAICQEIAVAHGGRVWVDSAEGRGSAFTLALPRADERPPVAAVPRRR